MRNKAPRVTTTTMKLETSSKVWRSWMTPGSGQSDWARFQRNTGQGWEPVLSPSLKCIANPFQSPRKRNSLWARIVKNPDCSTGPLARLFTHSLAPLTWLFALHYSLRSRAPLRSLTSLTPSLVRQWMIRWLSILCFFSVLAHSGIEERCARYFELVHFTLFLPLS